MKRIAFILSIVLISLFSMCNAQSNRSEAATMAKQFGYYVAFGDAVKASFNVSPSSDITEYVNQAKDEIDQNGGLKEILIDNEEVVNSNESKVTVTFVCKKEDVKIQKTYTLLKQNDSWKIATDKL